MVQRRLRSLTFVAVAAFAASAAAGLVACGSSSSNDGDGQNVHDASAADTAFPTTSTDKAQVKCGRDASCEGEDRQCCSETFSSYCVAPGASCGRAFRFDCDGPEDCAPGQSCCEGEKGKATTGTTCRPAASCNGGKNFDLPYRVCHVDGDCTGDDRPHCCFSGLNQVLIGTCHQNPCP